VRVTRKREGLSLTLKHMIFMMRQRVTTLKSFKTVRLVDDVDTKRFWWVTGTVIVVTAHQCDRKRCMSRSPLLDRGQRLCGLMNVGRMQKVTEYNQFFHGLALNHGR